MPSPMSSELGPNPHDCPCRKIELIKSSGVYINVMTAAAVLYVSNR